MIITFPIRFSNSTALTVLFRNIEKMAISLV